MRQPNPFTSAALVVAAVLLVDGRPTPRAGSAAPVHLLTLDGVVNPLGARYVAAGLARAAGAGATLAVLQLDTPGGLESSMRDVIGAILASPVPVAVWVAPAGGRAASAGMFITLAGHVAAMAPGTNIGAAHPVRLGGGEGVDETRAAKVVNDAAALARSLATTRGRNAAWAEDAVRESVSVSAREALEAGVVDLIAADLGSLLARLDGRAVTTTAGPRTLATAGADVVAVPMSLPARVLQAVTDPNVAYLLFTLGAIGIVAELYNPGLFVPGIVGALALVVAFVAFGSLPINWAAVLLLGLAFVLLVAEILTAGVGVLAAAGVVAFVLGSLMLYSPLTPSPLLPAVAVSPWLVGAMALTFLAFFVVVVRALVHVQRTPVATGAEALVGRTALAASDVAPTGTVTVGGERWRAEAVGEPVPRGERATVVAVEGVTLRVARVAPARTETGPPGPGGRHAAGRR
jgi:membrane-bound serine protease (ClpP class)